MKIIAAVFFFFLFFIFSANAAKASLILINKQGEVIWNVLSFESSLSGSSIIDVKDIADRGGSEEEISLAKNGNRVDLKVGEEKELDVSGFGSDLIEIEERGKTKKLEIGLKEDKFSIREGDVTALTVYPINISPLENRLSLLTATGEKFLNILPFEAGQVALRSRIINRITQNTFEISEAEKDLSYRVVGERVINVFNLLKVNIPVSAQISASSGEVISVDQPAWLRVLGFVFS